MTMPNETKRNTNRTASTIIDVPAGAALALFGRPLASMDEDDCSDEHRCKPCAGARGVEDSMNPSGFRSAGRRLSLTTRQHHQIERMLAELRPLIADLRSELREKEWCLTALHPGDARFVVESASLSNDIGSLATQIALVSTNLRTDIYDVLTERQRQLFMELRTAFAHRDSR